MCHIITQQISVLRPPKLAVRIYYQLCPAGVSVLLFVFGASLSIRQIVLAPDTMTLPVDSRGDKRAIFFYGFFTP